MKLTVNGGGGKRGREGNGGEREGERAECQQKIMH